jgi:hypothetical protein
MCILNQRYLASEAFITLQLIADLNVEVFLSQVVAGR